MRAKEQYTAGKEQRSLSELLSIATHTHTHTPGAGELTLPCQVEVQHVCKR